MITDSSAPRPLLCLGRERDLVALEALASRHRAIAILGAGGIGKTTLAHVLAERARARGGEVFVIDTADVSNADALVLRVADTLGVAVMSSTTTEVRAAQITERLRAHPETWLLLDQVEHLLPGAATYLAQWSARAEGATLTLTSRARVGLEEVAAYNLGPLDAEASFVLFTTRTRALHADRAPTAAEEADTRALLEALGHIPLAVELAAARTRTLTPAEVLARVHADAGVLADEARGDSRHSNLERVFDDMLAALDDDERNVLFDLSAFAGELRAPDAEAVCAPPSKGRTVLAVLDVLSDRSLLRVSSHGGRVWLRLLDPLRALLTKRNARAGESRAAHVRHFAERAASLFDELDSRAWREPFIAVEERLADYALAFQHANPAATPANARFSLGFALAAYYHRRGARALFEAVCARIGPAPSASPGRAELGIYRLWLEHAWSVDRVEEGLALAKVVEGACGGAKARVDAARTLLLCARAYTVAEVHADAERCLSEASSIARREKSVLLSALAVFEHARIAMMREAKEIDADAVLTAITSLTDEAHRWHRAAALRILAWQHELGGDPRTLDDLDRAEALFEACGSRIDIAQVRMRRVAALVAARRDEEALTLVVSFLESEGTMSAATRYNCLGLRGRAALRLGKHDLAISSFEEALAMVRDLPRADHAIGSRVWCALAQARAGRAHDALASLERARAGDVAGPLHAFEVACVAATTRYVLASSGAAPPPPDDTIRELRAHAETLGAVGRYWVTEEALLMAEKAAADLRDAKGTNHRILVALDGSSFVSADGATVSLARRPILRKLLQTLAAHRREHGDTTLPSLELVARAYPGDKASMESLLGRLYTQVWELRRAGLGEGLERIDDGYRLASTVTVEG